MYTSHLVLGVALPQHRRVLKYDDNRFKLVLQNFYNVSFPRGTTRFTRRLLPCLSWPNSFEWSVDNHPQVRMGASIVDLACTR